MQSYRPYAYPISTHKNAAWSGGASIPYSLLPIPYSLFPTPCLYGTRTGPTSGVFTGAPIPTYSVSVLL
jgi:hypothetical protein